MSFFCDRFFPYKMSPSQRAKETTSFNMAVAVLHGLQSNTSYGIFADGFPKQDALKCVKFLKRWQIIAGSGLFKRGIMRQRENLRA